MYLIRSNITKTEEASLGSSAKMETRLSQQLETVSFYEHHKLKCVLRWQSLQTLQQGDQPLQRRRSKSSGLCEIFAASGARATFFRIIYRKAAGGTARAHTPSRARPDRTPLEPYGAPGVRRQRRAHRPSGSRQRRQSRPPRACRLCTLRIPMVSAISTQFFQRHKHAPAP